MGTQQVKPLVDITHGAHGSRLRLLVPLRYLAIRHPEKTKYDIWIPTVIAAASWGLYCLIEPKPSLFGEAGLLRFARDLLIMGVPFMIGALAAVSMGAPGPHLDRRPVGVDLRLDNDVLTLRQFLCYLLGYLSFLGLVTLVAVVAASLLQDAVSLWTVNLPTMRLFVYATGTLALAMLLSFLSVTVFWSLYFLTDVGALRRFLHPVGEQIQ
jgi:hypothetical protein